MHHLLLMRTKLHAWTLPAPKVALGTSTLFTSCSSNGLAVVMVGNQILKSAAAAGYRPQAHPPPSFAWAVLWLTLRNPAPRLKPTCSVKIKINVPFCQPRELKEG